MKNSQNVFEKFEKWINRLCNSSKELQDKYLPVLILEQKYFKNLLDNYGACQIKAKPYKQ
jgi:hypothetical protein